MLKAFPHLIVVFLRGLHDGSLALLDEIRRISPRLWAVMVAVAVLTLLLPPVLT